MSALALSSQTQTYRNRVEVELDKRFNLATDTVFLSMGSLKFGDFIFNHDTPHVAPSSSPSLQQLKIKCTYE